MCILLFSSIVHTRTAAAPEIGFSMFRRPNASVIDSPKRLRPVVTEHAYSVEHLLHGWHCGREQLHRPCMTFLWLSRSLRADLVTDLRRQGQVICLLSLTHVLLGNFHIMVVKEHYTCSCMMLRLIHLPACENEPT